MGKPKVIIIDDRHILIVERTFFNGLKTTYLTVNAKEKMKFLNKALEKK